MWSAAGARLATGTFTGESAPGLADAYFATPVAVTAGTTYVVSYYAPNGHYAADGGYFTADVTNGPLTAPAGDQRCLPVRHRRRLPHRHLERHQLLGRPHLHPGTPGLDGTGGHCGGGGSGRDLRDGDLDHR